MDLILINHDELKYYQELVDSKAKINSNETLANAGQYHAAIAMSKLLDETKTIARMVVGSFDGRVSNQENYLGSLRSAIEKDVKFQILFLDLPNTNSKAFKMLLTAKKAGKPIECKMANNSLIDKLSKEGKVKHFSVFDNNKYRFEKDTENYLAWFSFNDLTNASTLINVFDTEFPDSKKVVC
ncbi:hypothetical protein [Mucilaginibacter gilvus]|nr:hypothetical protein [Mucilaginibacter gilvus]